MATFKYIDNTNYPKTVIIFECQAELLTEADKLYEKATGKNLMKQPHIGCQVT
jgi:hypothetical protein